MIFQVTDPVKESGYNQIYLRTCERVLIMDKEQWKLVKSTLNLAPVKDDCKDD